ncbi:hypothetical protein WA026_007547 [Henosepilachna vigintioctopunctata]|uniref:FLYWCH-type domain-containing protein n=1 Tax=Henosepilachna vigintioctopunctata TaxID=420089 RepID=A0AAW1UXY6_9CUCU
MLFSTKTFSDPAYFIRTPRGLQLCYQKEIYFCDKKYGNAGFWGCSHYRRLGCKARIKTIGNRLVFIKNSHNHTSGGFVDEETYQDETVKVINEDASYKVIRLGRVVHFYQGRKHPMLVFNHFEYMTEHKSTTKTFWRCRFERVNNCKARLLTGNNTLKIMNSNHSHPPTYKGDVGTLTSIVVNVSMK